MPIDFIPSAEEVPCKIVPWVKFKQLLFDIYDHRIEHAWEINGAINNTYLALEEHLILFFLEKYRDKPRSAIELHIIEFLATVKYYSDYWKRAKTFAVMYGLLKSEDSFISGRRSGTSDTRLPPRLNDGRMGELEQAHCDIFAQEFFFHAYCTVTAQREHFLESAEGFTYIPYRYQDAISKRLLTPFVSDRQYSKWTSRIKQFIRRTKLTETDDADSEYIDVDILISQF